MINSVQGQAGSLVLTALTTNAGYLLIALFEGAAESHVFSTRGKSDIMFAWKSSWIQRETSCSLSLLPTFPMYSWAFDVLN